jgi:hypothetical protein
LDPFPSLIDFMGNAPRFASALQLPPTFVRQAMIFELATHDFGADDRTT